MISATFSESSPTVQSHSPVPSPVHWIERASLSRSSWSLWATSSSSGGSRNLERGVQPRCVKYIWKFCVAMPTSGHSYWLVAIASELFKIAGSPNWISRSNSSLVKRLEISKELIRECVNVPACCCCMPLLHNHLMDLCSYVCKNTLLAANKSHCNEQLLANTVLLLYTYMHFIAIARLCFRSPHGLVAFLQVILNLLVLQNWLTWNDQYSQYLYLLFCRLQHEA